MPISDRLLLGPGPSNPYPEAVAALARPMLGHMDPEFIAIMDETMARLRTVFRTDNALTFPVSGTGSAGMEACFVNLVEAGDTVIVGVNGVFGERMCEVARRCGADVVRVDEEWGLPLDPQRLLDAQREHPHARLLAVVHAETSTGVENDVAPLAALRDTNTLLLVDTVTSLGGIPVEIDGWNVDAAYSGTQKCLGVPPGLSPVTFSPRAVDRITTRALPPQSWYLDVSLIANYVDGASRVYHHTAPVSMVMSLHAGPGRAARRGARGGLGPAPCRGHPPAGLAARPRLPSRGARRPPPARAHHRLAARRAPTTPPCARRCSPPTASRWAAGWASSRARRGASASWATRRATARSRRCSARSRELLG